MNKRIILIRSESGWMAQFVNDSNITELFGTDILPTAFTKNAEESMVLREIQRLNPNCLVEIGGNHET